MSLALLRIERKLDLILNAMRANDPVLQAVLASTAINLYAEGDTCPVCNDVVQVRADLATEGYDRQCSCHGPMKIVRGVSALLTPHAGPPHPLPEKEEVPDVYTDDAKADAETRTSLRSG